MGKGHRTRNLLLFVTIINEIITALAMLWIFGSESFVFPMFITSIIIGVILSAIIGTLADM